MRIKSLVSSAVLMLFMSLHPGLSAQVYKIIGTNVTSCYNNTTSITCPTTTATPFYGQFPGVNVPSYQANANATVTDLVTGLTWQRSPDQNGNNNGTIQYSDKLTWAQIQARLAVLNSTSWGGYSDWRTPAIKELFSLTDWNGTDPSGYSGSSTTALTPFLNNSYFQFAWGQVPQERLIDSQYASSNLYNELSFAGYQMLFGFNFADGRIKGYDLVMPGGTAKVFFFFAVLGNTNYGINHFVDNGDQTISDTSAHLMWTKDDSQAPMNWEAALAWAQAKNTANFCGHNDWRLPNAKELQSIVDYTRSPGSTGSAAIGALFNCTPITNEAGRPDWPWFWSSTTHRSYDGTSYHGDWAVYVCFGRAAGWMKIGSNSYYSYRDVHGAGAQRSSPKSGTFVGNYMGLDSLGHPVYGLGPQGDILRINNFVRLVRDYTPVSIPSQNTLLNLNFNNGTDTCFNATQTIVVAGGGTTFTVQAGATVTLVAGQNILVRPTTQVLPGGSLRAYITVNGQYCNTTTGMVGVDTGIGERVAGSASVKDHISLYPNPARERCYIRMPETGAIRDVRICVVDAFGRVVMEQQAKDNGVVELPVQQLPAGIYLVRVTQAGMTWVTKLVKEP